MHVASASDEIRDFSLSQNKAIARYLYQQSLDIQQQTDSLNNYLLSIQKEYDTWYKQCQRECDAFYSQIKKKWGFSYTPSPKKWVEYSIDTTAVSVVDFESGVVEISLLIPSTTSPTTIKLKAQQAIKSVLTSRGTLSYIPIQSVDTAAFLPYQPLHDQISSADMHFIEKIPSPHFIDSLLTHSQKKSTPSGTDTTLVFSFSLVPDHLKKRIIQYLPYIEKQCARFNLNKAQVLAMIHTESAFNPLARSPAHAIGLMQIVPQSGGAEAYQYLTGKNELPPYSVLFDPQRNIELGCAYLYLLKNRYFSSVDDTLSIRHCTIAGYNGGPSMVAYTFAGKHNFNEAITVINTIENPDRVYAHLIRYLPALETRQYLRYVTERMELYQ